MTDTYGVPPKRHHFKPDPTGPLAEANLRLSGKAPAKVDPALVIGMKAAGVPQSKIARVLDVQPNTVAAALDRVPNANELISTYRDRLKSLKIQKAHQVEGKLWARLEREVDEGEAKSVDAIARALHASEKIQASVSGEGQKVEVAGNASADVKILIAQLLADDSSPNS